jgi:hypothetical protein
LLVKPGGTFDELPKRRVGHAQSFRAEAVAQEVEASGDATDEGLVGVPLEAAGAAAAGRLLALALPEDHELKVRLSTIRAFGRVRTTAPAAPWSGQPAASIPTSAWRPSRRSRLGPSLATERYEFQPIVAHRRGSSPGWGVSARGGRLGARKDRGPTKMFDA